MILMATGHAGVDQFIREANPPNVHTADSWAAASEFLALAERIFIGQRIPDFSEALRWLEEHKRSGVGGQVVLWVDDGFEDGFLSGLSDVVVWRGEMDGERLMDWWKPIAREALDLPRRWSIISLFPYPAIEPLITVVTDAAKSRYGTDGGWIDCDVAHAELSMNWRPRLYERTDYPFERLKIHRVKQGYLIPASPPWLPGRHEPSIADLDRLINQKWTWQGWHLGFQLSRKEAVFALSRIPRAILWMSIETPLTAVQKTVEFCRIYNSDLQITLVSALPLAIDEATLRALQVTCAILSHENKTGSTKKVGIPFNFARRKKE